MRLRANSITGTIDVTLTDSGTTLTSEALTALPALTAGVDYYVATIDPLDTPEIVYITAHTADASTATMIRGKEDTVGAAHSAGVPLVLGPTAIDFLSTHSLDAIDFPVHTPTAADDEFNDPVDNLDGKWTVLQGTKGDTTDLTRNTDPTNLYEVRDGRLHCQIYNSTIQLRQSYTLATDMSVVVKATWVTAFPDAGGANGNACQVGMALGNDPASWNGSESSRLIAYNPATYGNIWLGSDGGAVADSACGGHTGRTIYLRIMREGDQYWGAYSHDGLTWVTVDEGTNPASDYTYIFLASYDADSTTLAPNRNVWFDWVRVGNHEMFPW